MHLVLAAVALVDGEAIKIARQVIGRPRVYVPVGVDDVGARVGSVAGALSLIFRMERMVEAVAAVEHIMTKLAIDLTLQVAAAIVTTASTAAMIATVVVVAALSTLVAATS